MGSIMAKKIFAIVLVLLVLCGVFLGAYSMHMKSLTGDTYTYKEGKEYLINPYIGYAPSTKSVSLCMEASLVYMNLYWSELEPVKGQFNWLKITKGNYLQRWRNEGKHLVLRFVCDCPTDEPHMDIPKWLYEETGDGTFYDMEYGKGYSPNYNNSTFIKEHERVIKEIADHFSEDGFLAYVELGSLGHWGEWHTNYSAGIDRMPLTMVRAMYVSHYVQSFDYCKLLMRRPFAELPDGAGVFNDMAGISHDTSIWLSWIEKGGEYNETGEKNGLKAVPGIWEKAPVGGEFASSVPISTMLGKDYDQTVELLKTSHMSFIGPMVPYVKRENEAFYEASYQAAKYLGYRYRVKKLCIKKPFGSSYATVIGTLVNDGVAPIYFEFEPYIYLGLPNGTTAEDFSLKYDAPGYKSTEAEGLYKYRLDLDLKTLLPNQEYTFTITLPKSILKAAGSSLYIGIEDPSTHAPAILLDMDAPRLGKLSLLWENH